MVLFKISFSLVIIIQIQIAYFQTDNYYNRTFLAEKLLEGYNPFIRPVNSDETTVNVTFGVSLYRLAGFDVKEETITTLLWQRMIWRDEIIQWNPSEHGNATILRFEINDVWTPDIFPFNDVASYDPSMYEDAIPVRIKYDGTAYWSQPVVLTSTCVMDVTDFPYDTQRCKITYGPWQHRADELDIFCEDDTIDVDAYTNHTQWALLETLCTRVVHSFSFGTFSEINYMLVYKRLNTFYTKNLLLPNALLLGVTALVFFLPVDCGERIGYGVTLTLALCVNLMIVTEYIPETSRTFPDVGNYFLNSIILSGIAIILAALSINVHLWYQKKQMNEKVPEDRRQSTFFNMEDFTNHVTSSDATQTWDDQNEQPLRRKFSTYRSRLRAAFKQNGTHSPFTTVDWIVGFIYGLVVNLYSIYFIKDLANRNS